MNNLASSLNPCEDIALGAYVDGELDECARSTVEDHLRVCDDCRAGLRAHQYFLRELDAAMTRSVNFPVPKNFSRMITARATSEMRGLRSSGEHKKALGLCLGLLILAFSLLGGPSRQFLSSLVRRVVGNVMILADAFWTTIYNVTTSVVIVSRVISRRLVVESGMSTLLILFLAFAVLILSRLILNYHRARASD